MPTWNEVGPELLEVLRKVSRHGLYEGEGVGGEFSGLAPPTKTEKRAADLAVEVYAAIVRAKEISDA